MHAFSFTVSLSKFSLPVCGSNSGSGIDSGSGSDSGSGRMLLLSDSCEFVDVGYLLWRND
jgi:hypothetical protein